MYFDKQEFVVMHKCSAYYASIMLNAFRHLAIKFIIMPAYGGSLTGVNFNANQIIESVTTDIGHHYIIQPFLVPYLVAPCR